MLMYASLALTGLSIFLVTNLMFQEEDEYKAQEKLESGAGSDKESLAQHGIVLRYSRPFFRRYVTPIVSGFKNKKKIRERYKRKLASAGLTEVLSPEDFFSFKLFLIVGFPIMFLLLRTFLEETWPLNYIFFISIFIHNSVALFAPLLLNVKIFFEVTILWLICSLKKED